MRSLIPLIPTPVLGRSTQWSGERQTLFVESAGGSVVRIDTHSQTHTRALALCPALAIPSIVAHWRNSRVHRFVMLSEAKDLWNLPVAGEKCIGSSFRSQ